MIIQASAVATGSGALVISGQPGSGKSRLAWRFIAGGARLIADDLLEMEQDGEGVWLCRYPRLAPRELRGLLYCRMLGFIAVPHCVSPVRVADRIDLA
ncbi:MAG TPA: hypothetical protein VHL08_04105 [Dongiaceae bacterium]|jgi:serine kinase of HPr protein (carbohydrate metabolism regulator)|nr:hypothetical protein [Dongiaceae bacterium]